MAQRLGQISSQKGQNARAASRSASQKWPPVSPIRTKTASVTNSVTKMIAIAAMISTVSRYLVGLGGRHFHVGVRCSDMTRTGVGWRGRLGSVGRSGLASARPCHKRYARAVSMTTHPGCDCGTTDSAADRGCAP